MAAVVDEQNADEPGYQPMCADLDGSPSFQAALDLVFSGRREPNGYTERALTRWRQRAKSSEAAGGRGAQAHQPAGAAGKPHRLAGGPGARGGGGAVAGPPQPPLPQLAGEGRTV